VSHGKGRLEKEGTS
jgi:hypothetical protein